MGAVSIRPVVGRSDLKQFIELPYRLRRDDPEWVPPLRFERRRFLDRDRNPWFEHAEAELLLAERGGEVVGRTSAHIDHRWDEFQGGNDGMFGFFDAEDDAAVVGALIEAASGWLRERGREDELMAFVREKILACVHEAELWLHDQAPVSQDEDIVWPKPVESVS